MSIFHGEDRFFDPPKVQEGLQHHIYLIFDGKQHCKNIWFHGRMLKSPLTSVLKHSYYIRKENVKPIIDMYAFLLIQSK